MDKNRFVPEDRGRLVTAFLTSFFERYVDSNFTAGLEEKLDDVSDGRLDWRALMRAFWEDFSKTVEQTRELKITDVINALDEDLGPHFFPARADGADPRLCPSCHNGRLGLKLGRYGSFIGCSNYPECQFTKRLAVEGGEGDSEVLKDGMRNLGQHPETREEITVRRGPYGLYVQQGEPDPNDKKAKPRRTSLPKGVDGEAIQLEQALGLLSLPRHVGIHPETKLPIEAGLGRFGPYVKMGSIFGSLDKDDDILAVGLNRAVDVLARKMANTRVIGTHPKDNEAVQVRKGRFGPYLQHGQMVANLPKSQTMEDVTLEEALATLAEKGKALKPKPGRGKVVKAKAPTKAKAAPRVEAVAAVAKAAKPKKAAAKKAKPKAKAKAKAAAK
jgi:DNA topoisomerase-1